MQQHQTGRYEAAIEGAYPTRFNQLDAAKVYVAGQPVGPDGTRPWIRDTQASRIRGSFIIIGGKEISYDR